MADNYLEQRMDDLRAGRLKAAANRRPGSPPPSRKVFIPDVTAFTPEDIRQLVHEGCSVWFAGGDLHTSSRLARTLGCRFLPPGMLPPPDAELIPQA